jgi:hypothetical protein
MTVRHLALAFEPKQITGTPVVKGRSCLVQTWRNIIELVTGIDSSVDVFTRLFNI